jgi:hypothetical protein
MNIVRLVQRIYRLAYDLLHTLITLLTSRKPFLLLRHSSSPIMFTLDLHTSVVRDLRESLEKNQIRVERFSISGASYLFNEPNLRLPFISRKTWRSIGDVNIRGFQRLFQGILDKAQYFLVTFTFSFVLIFENLGKPILAVNATRYESPFTFDEIGFRNLNGKLETLSKLGLLSVISNNAGDRDYLNWFTGIETKHIPSLCSYSAKHSPSISTWLIQSRNLDLGREISQKTLNAKLVEDVFPSGYSHEDFAKFAGVILIPYNISTMRLFELSTSGMPVRIPSDRLLREWSGLPGVLSELSWVQIVGTKCPIWLRDTPADPEWSDFLDWWLDRADWKNKEFFPNVSTFDSLDELSTLPPPFTLDSVNQRNETIRRLTDQAIKDFKKLTIK